MSSTTTIAAEDWITRADMATLKRCSEYTVGRDVKRNKLKIRHDEAGRVLVHVADFLRLGLVTTQDLTIGATPAESAAVVRARDTVTALKAQVGELTGRLTESDLVRDTLREQLAVKDKQIAQQATQLSQLTQVIARLGQVGGAA